MTLFGRSKWPLRHCCWGDRSTENNNRPHAPRAGSPRGRALAAVGWIVLSELNPPRSLWGGGQGANAAANEAACRALERCEGLGCDEDPKYLLLLACCAGRVRSDSVQTLGYYYAPERYEAQQQSGALDQQEVSHTNEKPGSAELTQEAATPRRRKGEEGQESSRGLPSTQSQPRPRGPPFSAC